MSLAGLLVGFLIIFAASFVTWTKHNNIIPRDALSAPLGIQSGQLVTEITGGEVVRIPPTGLEPVVIVPYNAFDVGRIYSDLN